MSRLRCAGVLALRLGLVALSACHRSAVASLDSGPAAQGDASNPAEEASVPARCTWKPTAASTPSLCDVVEVGESVATARAGEVAFGVVESHAAALVASVVRAGAGTASTVVLGDACRPTEAPQPFATGAGLFAAACVRPDRPKTAVGAAPTRHVPSPLAVFRVDTESYERLVELPGSPESYDVIGGAGHELGALLVWGEDDEAPAPGSSVPVVGGLKLAAISADLRTVSAMHPVVDTKGAQDPRLALREGGYWLTWVATRPEHPEVAPSGEVEVSSEERAFAWLEVISLDAKGTPVGQARALTSSTGHLGGYAAWAHGGALELIAGDGVHGKEGGSLLRLIVHPDGSVEPASPLASGVDVGTPPSVVAGPTGRAWVSYVDRAGDPRLLSLDGAAPSRASQEPSLATGRMLAVAPGPEPLVAFAVLQGVTPPGGRGGAPTTDACAWSFRWASCAP